VIKTRHILVALLALGAFLLAAASASAAHSLTFCAEQGSDAGQCKDPERVAVDQATGDVYVADPNNHRVDEFTKEGTFLLAFGWGVLNGKEELQTCTVATSCQEGLGGSGVGEFSGGVSIAVDNLGIASEGDVYVSEPNNKRVQKFTLNPVSGQEEVVLLFGPDVTLSGPDNHTNDLQQTLTIGATSGLLHLCFERACAGGGGTAEFTEGSDVITIGGKAPNSGPPRVGQTIEAIGLLPPGTKIVKVDESAGTLTLSANATATANGGNSNGGAPFVSGMPFDAPAATVQSELNALPTIGGVGGSVSVSGGPGGSNPYVITFGGSLAGGDVPMLEPDTIEEVAGELRETKEYALSGGGPEVCKPASGDTCQAGSPDSGAGGFSERGSLPVAVGSSGEVWVGDVERAEQFSSEGAFAKEVPLAGAGTVAALALEKALAGEDLYVLSSKVAGVQKVAESGMSVGAPYPLDASGHPNALGVDPATGDVFVSDQEQGGEASLFEYGSTGAFLESFGTGAVLGAPSGDALAFGDTAGGVYVVGGQAVQFFVPPPPGPQVETGSLRSEPVKNASATLHAAINPENAKTTYYFEYISEQRFDEDGNSFGAGAIKTAESASIGEDLAEHPVSMMIAGLSPETTYRFRAVATNINGTGNSEEEQATFTTLPPVGIESESASGVAATSATLQAQVNPLGSETTYYFEYSTAATESCTPATCATLPAAPGASLGSGEEPLPVSVHVQGLTPGTTYHYRLVAVNALTGGEGRGGEDLTFTTQASDSETSLPDGRQYEMVTPPNKHGAGIYPGDYKNGDDLQAAADGGGLTFAATAPFAADPAGSRAIENTQVLSLRHAPGDWGTQDITTAHDEGASEVAAGEDTEYQLFSNDLSLGFVEPKGDTPLSPPVLAGEKQEKTVYLRESNGAYKALVTAANVPEGTEFGGDGELNGGVSFEGASPDLDHVVLSGAGPLVEGAPAKGGLYEWSAGKPASEPLPLVSVLPKGEPTNAELGGGGNYVVRRAISDDGSRVIWAERGERRLYLRDMASKETIQVDAAQGAPEPVYGTGAAADPSLYQTANGEGSRVFFTSPERLTADSTAPLKGQDGYGAEDLYVFELTSGTGEPLAGRLTDLTVAAGAGEYAGVTSVIGASEDGTYFYFVAGGVLGDGGEQGATRGSNLYLEHYDAAIRAWEAPEFIAANPSTLGKIAGPGASPLPGLPARVSPNGRYLAFMSVHPLTDYDNRDANSGVPDEEVYEYDAASRTLTCASCNPTGARPLGVLGETNQRRLVDYDALWEGQWLAANVPGWTPVGLIGTRSVYQPRYLSDSGRLFFDSSDALVPADVNGQEDVYEYEPAGVPAGSPYACGPASTDASDVFEPAKRYQTVGGQAETEAGCVALISSGTSSEESAFLDASESGGDVFFLTTSKLALADYDTSYDVYDAHECTSEAQCASPEQATSPPCETESSCKAAPSPQPEIYGAPASATFSGAGNITQPPPAPPKKVTKKTVKCAKGKHLSHNKCVKTKHKKKLKARKSAHTNRRTNS
jgi:hypothetical protein